MVRRCTPESGIIEPLVECNQVYTGREEPYDYPFLKKNLQRERNYVRIHINVKDNGIGMSQDFLKKNMNPIAGQMVPGYT